MLAAAVLLLGASLALLNSTSTNVAIPSIQEHLRLSAAGLTWSLAGWALTYALVLIPAGRLGDRFGHKWLFVIGMSGFVVTSIACAVSVNEFQFTLARLLQGLAGGVFFPSIAAMLSELFSGRQRIRAFAVLGATLSVAAGIGPILGGALLQAIPGDMGWRAMFLLNVLIGVVAVAGALFLLPARRQAGSETGIDLLGLGILTIALIGILLALILGTDLGWPVWVWFALFGGIALMALFMAWERLRERRGAVALVPPTLFRNRRFALTSAISFTQFAGFISIFYLLSIFWQSGMGGSALEVGLLTLPEAFASVAGAAMITRLSVRWGARAVMILGTAVLTLGVALLALCITLVPAEHLTAAWLILPLAITGLGSGLGLSVITNYALSSLDPRYAGVGSGIIATMQRTGNAVGLAVSSSVLFTLLGRAAEPGEGTSAHYSHAAAGTFWVCASITAIGLLLSLRLPAEHGHREPPSSK